MTRYANPVPQIAEIRNGVFTPIVGAKKYFYETGTATPKTIYSDSSLTIPQTNPVLSDSEGRFPDIFLDGIYREVQEDELGNTLWTRDPVGEVESGQFADWANDATYNIPDIVKGSDDKYYRSLTDNNQGNDPVSSPVNWEALRFGREWNTNVTYGAGDIVFGSDDRAYTSLIDSNAGNDPVSSPLAWAIGDFLNSILIKNTNYTIETKDRGSLISVTASATINLLPVATAGRGFPITIYNSGAGTVVVDGDGGETVNGNLTLTLQPGDTISLTTSGSTGWEGVLGINPDATRVMGGDKTYTGRIIITGLTPVLRLIDSDATADNGIYDFIIDTESLKGRILNDIASVATTWLQIDRTTTTVDTVNFPNGTLQSQGNDVVSTSSGDQDIAGVKKFTSKLKQESTGSAGLTFRNNSGAVDEKVWDYDISASQFVLRTVNDASTGAQTVYVVDRTGITVDNINFPNGTFQINGNNLDPGADISNWKRGNATYIEDDSGGAATSFNVTAVIGAAWESVGPTSSGATNIWTGLNDLPTGGQWVGIRIDHESADSSTSTDTRFHGRVTGSATAVGTKTLLSKVALSIPGSGSTSVEIRAPATARLPIDSSGRFDLYVQSITGTATIEIVLEEMGY